jgi:hypothetical protein
MKRVTEKTVVLKETLSPDLALRDTADSLFDMIEASSADKIMTDFSGIRSITRSFAHQYSIRKKASPKSIVETCVPANVRKMLNAVRHTQKKNRLAILNRVKARPLKVDLRAYLF